MKKSLSNLLKLNFSAIFKGTTESPLIGFFRYCIVGGIAFLIDFGCYLLLTSIGVHYLISGLIAFILSFLFNFYLSRIFIFQTKCIEQKAILEIIKVLVVAIIGLLLTEILLWICVYFLKLSYSISKIIASAIVLIWNYLGRRYFVYKQYKSSYTSQIKIWLKLSLIVVLCVLIGIGLLTVVYCIPTETINKNLIISADILEKEGLYPVLDSNTSSTLDNYTDSLMLHTAGYNITKSPLVEAVLINRLECVDNISPLNSLLCDIKDTGQPMEIISYSTYWHGYLVFLKPLLTLFSYQQIRFINTIIQCLLLVVLFSLMIKNKMHLYIAPTLLLFGFQGMASTFLSLQFSNVFYIYVVGLILLLLFYKNWKNTSKILIYFTLLGAITAYLDLLTYPLVTFGVPVVLLLVLEKKLNLFSQIRTVISSGFAWLLGFAGMWIGKGAIGSLITGNNIFAEMFSSVKFRTTGSAGNKTVSFYSAIGSNILGFFRSNFLIFAVLFCLLFFFLILFQYIKTKQANHILKNLGFILICIAPVCWYIVLKQHSYIHYWFTCRELLISLFSITTMLVKIYIEGKQIKKEIS